MPKWETLEGDQCYYHTPTKIESMMTATHFAKQERDGAITLHYLGGEEETRRSDDQPWIGDFSSYLAIVSWVQEGRSKE